MRRYWQVTGRNDASEAVPTGTGGKRIVRNRPKNTNQTNSVNYQITLTQPKSWVAQAACGFDFRPRHQTTIDSDAAEFLKRRMADALAGKIVLSRTSPTTVSPESAFPLLFSDFFDGIGCRLRPYPRVEGGKAEQGLRTGVMSDSLTVLIFPIV